jgi:hypothetical protein
MPLRSARPLRLNLAVAATLVLLLAHRSPAVPLAARPPDAAPAAVRRAVERALPFVESGGVAWMTRGGVNNKDGCVSCHRVAFMVWTHDEARQRGFTVDTEKLEAWTNWSLERSLARGKEGGGLDTMSQLLLARRDPSTSPARPAAERQGLERLRTLWENILDRQKPDGSWPPEGQLVCPPEVTTGWALLALSTRFGDSEAVKQSRARALAYLKATPTQGSTEALLLRMLVERRYGDAARAQALRRDLLTRQHPDGGWGYLKDSTVGDAFATGQVLYAVSEDGPKGADAAIRRAVAFLVRTQRDDGSWLVPTAQIHSVEGTKPERLERLDEVNSYWGSAWATLGILRTLPAKRR